MYIFHADYAKFCIKGLWCITVKAFIASWVCFGSGCWEVHKLFSLFIHVFYFVPRLRPKILFHLQAWAMYNLMSFFHSLFYRKKIFIDIHFTWTSPNLILSLIFSVYIIIVLKLLISTWSCISEVNRSAFFYSIQGYLYWDASEEELCPKIWLPISFNSWFHSKAKRIVTGVHVLQFQPYKQHMIFFFQLDAN